MKSKKEHKRKKKNKMIIKPDQKANTSEKKFQKQRKNLSHKQDAQGKK